MSSNPTPPSFGFTRGDVIVVTGAGSGIGRATALHAARMGLRISAWDLNPETLAVTVDQIEGLEGLEGPKGPSAPSGTVVPVTADVSDPEAVDAGFARTRADLGAIRYLFNNAGPSSAVDLDFDLAVRISVGSVRRMTEAWAAGGLPEGAAMVSTSSVAGNKIGTESDWYSASKAALMGYTRHLAAHRAGEFRSNAVAPGMTDTPRLAGFASSETGQRSLARNPLGRMATPDDIAFAALFLLSPLAAYVNGVLLPVDGGWTVTQ